FFFQAEDGIRDFHVTGVQTCALPIFFEPDPSGTFIESSYIYATMRDYTRFGLLYLNKGNWLGEQILPEGWVEYTTASSEGSGGRSEERRVGKEGRARWWTRG